MLFVFVGFVCICSYLVPVAKFAEVLDSITQDMIQAAGS